MIRRLFRRMFKLALVLGAAAALYKVVQARRPSPDLPGSDAWPPAPAPKPVPTPTKAAPAAGATAAKAAANEASTAAKDVAKNASAAAKDVAKEASTAAKDVAKDASAAAKDVAAKAKAAAAEAQAAAKAAKSAPASGAPWVDPVKGACPPSHPVKAKLKSMIYHLPGMLAYDRTTPDRCYRDAPAAEADGLRKAKR